MEVTCRQEWRGEVDGVRVRLYIYRQRLARAPRVGFHRASEGGGRGEGENLTGNSTLSLSRYLPLFKHFTL